MPATTGVSTLRTSTRSNARLTRTEGDANADLLRAQRHAVRHHAEDAETGERQRDQADGAGDRAGNPRALHQLVEILAHRVRHGNDARIDRAGLAKDRRQ